MKSFFLIVFSIFFFHQSASAQNQYRNSEKSHLVLELDNGAPLLVSINNRRFEKINTRLIIGQLPKGRNRIQVYEISESRNGRRKATPVYYGTIKMKAGMNYYGIINPRNGRMKMTVSSQMPNLNNAQVPLSEQDAPTLNSTEQFAPPADEASQNFNSTELQMAGVPSAVMTQTKADLATKKTDTEKLDYLKTAVAENGYNTYQVGVLMDLLAFDDSKIKFAEMAFPKVEDPQNFAALEQKLSMEKYKTAFRNLIDSAQK